MRGKEKEEREEKEREDYSWMRPGPNGLSVLASMLE